MSSSKNPFNNNNAPSDASFTKQADVAREALRNFATISNLNVFMPGPVKTAMTELVEATVRSSSSNSYILDLEKCSGRV
jgi:hypothetical protein